MHKILITGASGFIGSFMVERALAEGMEVWAAVRPTSSRRYLQDGRINFIELDLANSTHLHQQLDEHLQAQNGRSFDYVIHAAGATKCRRAEDFFSINAEGTERLATCLLATGALTEAGRLVFISSLSVMGPIHEKDYKPICEADLARPNTAYGASKLQAEALLADIKGLNYVVLRPTGVYGPRERDYAMMADSIRRHIDFAVGYKPQVITFIYVADLVEAMKREGYPAPFAVGVASISSILGPIIPPSIVLIVYASITNVSVAELFLGSVLPGIILAVALIAYGLYYGHKHNLPAHEKPNLRKIGASVRKGIWALLMPVILLGGILSGIFTPTEASIVTCVYSLIVGVFVYKEIKLSDVPRIVYTNMRSCSSIIILIGLANVFAFILTNERIPQKVATAILSMTTNRILVILLINLVLIFVGMFMESLAAILITFPVLLPVATAVGMNPVHFALMAILNLMIGLTTPPVGMCICTGAQIGGVSSWKAFKANMPFLITSLIVLMLVSFCEPITLWIPSLFA